MIKRNFATIDNGGSEVRVETSGDEILHFPNTVIKINKKNFRSKETDDLFSVCEVVDAPNILFKGIFCIGSTTKNYTGEPIAFDNQKPKTDSPNYYQTLVLAVAQDAIRQARFDRNSSNGISQAAALFSEFISYDYSLVTLIPIKEHSGQKDRAAILKDNIAGAYSVKFPLLVEGITEVRFILEKKNISVLPEGGVAIIGLRATLQPDDVSLIMDMGHVTLDLALFKGKQLLSGSVISSQFAGATLMSDIKNALIDEGYRVTDDELPKAMSEGTIYGKDVSEIVRTCKERFVASTIKPEVLNLLNTARFGAQSIKNIIPIGAPMNSRGTTGSLPVLIQKECGLTTSTIRFLSDDLRYVNLHMAHKMAKALYNKATKE